MGGSAALAGMSCPNSDGNSMLGMGTIGNAAIFFSDVEDKAQDARGWVLLVFEVEEEGLTVVFTIGVEGWMILAFTMETGGFIVVFTVKVQDWMLLVFTTEEERLTVAITVKVKIAGWVSLGLGCIRGCLDKSLIVKP